MDARSLSPEDRQKFRHVLAGECAHLDKILERMKARGWYSMDPAFICIENAINCLRAAGLVVELADNLPPPPTWTEPPGRGAYPKPFVPG